MHQVDESSNQYLRIFLDTGYNDWYIATPIFFLSYFILQIYPTYYTTMII